MKCIFGTHSDNMCMAAAKIICGYGQLYARTTVWDLVDLAMCRFLGWIFHTKATAHISIISSMKHVWFGWIDLLSIKKQSGSLVQTLSSAFNFIEIVFLYNDMVKWFYSQQKGETIDNRAVYLMWMYMVPWSISVCTDSVLSYHIRSAMPRTGHCQGHIHSGHSAEPLYSKTRENVVCCDAKSLRLRCCDWRQDNASLRLHTLFTTKPPSSRLSYTTLSYLMHTVFPPSWMRRLL